MNFNWTILVWIAALIFVYAFGLFEGRGQGYKKRKAEEAESRKDVHAPEPVTLKVDDPGLLRIKNENGYITLDLDGTRVDTTALSSDQRKRLIEMLNLMRPWLEGRQVAAPTTPPPAPVPQLRPTPLTSTPPPPTTTPQRVASRAETIAKEDRPIPPAGSIVSQIDSILQSRIVGTPLEDKGVFLAQSPEGGVMVYVGLTKYMGVDDVPDPEVKAAIRSAIREWENRFTPGI
jgi:hypothetical protein